MEIKKKGREGPFCLLHLFPTVALHFCGSLLTLSFSLSALSCIDAGGLGLSAYEGATLSHVHPSHGTEVHPNGLCALFLQMFWGPSLGFFRKVQILFSPTIGQREKVSFKQVMPPPGSLHFRGGCASVCLRD